MDSRNEMVISDTGLDEFEPIEPEDYPTPTDEILTLVRWPDESISAVFSQNNKSDLFDSLDAIGNPTGIVKFDSQLLDHMRQSVYLDETEFKPVEPGFFATVLAERYPQKDGAQSDASGRYVDPASRLVRVQLKRRSQW